jgi:VTC domain
MDREVENPTPLSAPWRGEEVETGDHEFEALLDDFDSISLQATNESARMLKRSENKYVLTNAQFRRVLLELRDAFAILEIDGKKSFRYSSCYFDDQFQLFHDHHQGKRLRLKVRTRQYIDTGDVFFEMKLKERRGATNKKRRPQDVFVPDQIVGENLAMLRKFYREAYNKEFSLELKPSLLIDYRRVTLVAKAGGERTTIDYFLRFQAIDGPTVQIGDDFIIVETKSGDGKGIADHIMKKEHIRTVGSCSKYCIGAALTGGVEKYNNFLPMVRLVRQKAIGMEPYSIVTGCNSAGGGALPEQVAGAATNNLAVWSVVL